MKKSASGFDYVIDKNPGLPVIQNDDVTNILWKFVEKNFARHIKFRLILVKVVKFQDTSTSQ